MGKKSSSPPAAPDPKIAANAQADANREAILTSARVNRVNEYTPWGNLIWERTPGGGGAPGITPLPQQGGSNPAASSRWRNAGDDIDQFWTNVDTGEMRRTRPDGQYDPVSGFVTTPGGGVSSKPGVASGAAGSLDDMESWTRRVELNPSQQRQLDAQNALAEALLGKASTRAGQISDAPLSFAGLPALPGDFGAERNRVEDALYGRATSRLDPQFEKAQRDQETRLTNQGINIGTEAWSRAMDDFNRGRTDAYGAARDSAITGAGAEESRLFGMTMQQRQQLINEMLTERSTPWNEIAAILQGSPAMNSPNFSPSAQYQVAPADVMGAMNNQSAREMAIWQQGQADKNATMGSIAGLAGAALPLIFSSKEFKDRGGEADGDDLLDKVKSLPIEVWSYKAGMPMADGKTHVGPMAEDWAERFGGDGKTIDVIDAVGTSLAAVKAMAEKLERWEPKRAA